MKSLAVLLLMLFFRIGAVADTFAIKPIEAVEDVVHNFGDTQLVFTVDREMGWYQYDTVFQIFYKGKLQAQFRNLGSFEVFPAPTALRFIGLSNYGFRNPAVIVFNYKGEVELLAWHETSYFEYCEQSVTLIRVWDDAKEPGMRFLPVSRGGSGLRLRTCRGVEVDLFEEVARASSRAWLQKRDR